MENVHERLSQLAHRLSIYQAANAQKARLYDGKQRLEDLGISLPPTLSDLPAVLGWPAAAVDVLEERLEFEGWTDPGLDAVYQHNNLDIVSSLAHSDALIYGTSYVAVTAGDEAAGEPEISINAVSPFEMVGVRDPRTQRLTVAAQFIRDEADPARPVDRAVLYTPGATMWAKLDGGRWRVEREEHNGTGRVQVVQLVNRPRASKLGGRSEITPTIRYITEAGVRTLAGAEVAREFYAVPQRWMMGAPESFFLDEDGQPRGAWDAMMGRILAVEADPATGQTPNVGQFSAYSMSPFFEQLRVYSQVISAEAAIPPSYLGFVTDNPASADAIRMTENRLVKKAERRQSYFGRAWGEVARIVVAAAPDLASGVSQAPENIRPMWRDPATPTRAAMTDMALKLSSMGTITARGSYTMKLLGMTMQDRDMLARDWAKDTTDKIADRLAQRKETRDLVASEVKAAIRGAHG